MYKKQKCVYPVALQCSSPLNNEKKVSIKSFDLWEIMWLCVAKYQILKFLTAYESTSSSIWAFQYWYYCHPYWEVSLKMSLFGHHIAYKMYCQICNGHMFWLQAFVNICCMASFSSNHLVLNSIWKVFGMELSSFSNHKNCENYSGNKVPIYNTKKWYQKIWLPWNFITWKFAVWHTFSACEPQWFTCVTKKLPVLMYYYAWI